MPVLAGLAKRGTIAGPVTGKEARRKRRAEGRERGVRIRKALGLPAPRPLLLAKNFQGGLAVSKERRLGRGLEALLGRAWDDPQSPVAPTTSVEDPGDARLSRDKNGQVWLDCEAIARNPYQPRQLFDEAEIADLADSIRTHGILQPLVVRRSGEGFELIAGERRLRAAQAVDWRQVPVQIRDVDDRQMAELAIVENVQRKDLNAIEKAESFQRYIDQYQCTQEELASRVQVDRSTVANLLRLLELPVERQANGARRRNLARPCPRIAPARR